jgi:hypothetical protein
MIRGCRQDINRAGAKSVVDMLRSVFISQGPVGSALKKGDNLL